MATQSSVFTNTGDTSIYCIGPNAIDGIKDGDVETLFCPDETDAKAWLQIDLLKDYRVHEVSEKLFWGKCSMHFYAPSETGLKRKRSEFL